MSIVIEQLPPLTTLNGEFDAYCHVCWSPIYTLWASDRSPDHGRCPHGDYTAQTCPHSTCEAEIGVFIAKLRADGTLAPRKAPS